MSRRPIRSIFKNYFISQGVYRDRIHKKSRGSVIKNLNLKDLLDIPLPFPNQEKRDKIVREVDEIKAKVQSLRKEATIILQKTQQEVETILFHKA